MFFSKRAGNRYVDRGDLSSFDFDKNDFTIDGAWHDLDLSIIIGTGIKLLFIRCEIIGFDLEGEIYLKPKGNVNDYNLAHCKEVFSTYGETAEVCVLCNSDGIIQYKIVSGTYTTLNIVIKGAFAY